MRPFESRIALALVYGSVAKGLDHAGSDIDLLVVSDSVSTAELLPELLAIEDQLGRKVSPTVYRTEEFARKRAENTSFVSKILDQPTVLLLGNIEDPAAAR